jgi:hypothetical protein
MEKHAFLIIAHNEPRVLRVLLHLLDDPRNDVFLLLDARSEKMRREFAQWRQGRGGFRLLDDPPKVFWGDISQVQAEFRLFREAYAAGPYLYYHLLSGVDLPLCTMDALHRFFREHAGCEFVSYWDDEAAARDVRRKVGRYHFFTRAQRKGTLRHSLLAPVNNLLLALQKVLRVRRGGQGWDFRKGGNWVSVTHAFCGHLLSREGDVLRRFRHTLCPDEIFLQSVLWASPFREKLYRRGGTECESSLRMVDWHREGPKPYVWQGGDVPALLGSGALFARKFSACHWDAVAAVAAYVSGKEKQPLQ